MRGSVETIIFLDTHGHAAFSLMRSRGAMIKVVVVIVVTGDNGVKTWTKQNLPKAGSLVLSADSKDNAQQALENKISRQEDQPLVQGIEVVNEKMAVAKENF
ncbi:hypothetical protein BY996DRAFT_6409351 [Phakopsora pachyrhizi]|nr:hypothetical protein BY996DRAFT_6409351 [Phakopsora pachyrhizi]